MTDLMPSCIVLSCKQKIITKLVLIFKKNCIYQSEALSNILLLFKYEDLYKVENYGS